VRFLHEHRAQYDGRQLQFIHPEILVGTFNDVIPQIRHPGIPFLVDTENQCSRGVPPPCPCADEPLCLDPGGSGSHTLLSLDLPDAELGIRYHGITTVSKRSYGDVGGEDIIDILTKGILDAGGEGGDEHEGRNAHCKHRHHGDGPETSACEIPPGHERYEYPAPSSGSFLYRSPLSGSHFHA